MSARRLDAAAVQAALSDLTDWQLADGKLYRRFRFRDFRAAFGFMATCATIAEAMNHHPEWKNVYRDVEVWLTTHDAGGITELDLQLAREMDGRAG